MTHRGVLSPCFDDPLDRLDVDRPAGLGPVEIDQVNSRGRLRLPPSGHRRGVIAEDRFLVKIPLPEPDAAPSPQVDGRDHLHGLHQDHRVSSIASINPPGVGHRKDRPKVGWRNAKNLGHERNPGCTAFHRFAVKIFVGPRHNAASKRAENSVWSEQNPSRPQVFTHNRFPHVGPTIGTLHLP